tara:strand:- start:251531 stop:251767 length:237 start_codon:yes stop_codon:yes gene_type:complete
MKSQPFTWEAYNEEFECDPDFDLLAKFSFDHLTEAECNEIGLRMRQSAEALKAEVDALEADQQGRRRGRLTVIDGGEA